MELSRELAEVARRRLWEASLARIRDPHRDCASVGLMAWRASLDRETTDRGLRARKSEVAADGFRFVALEGVGSDETGPVTDAAPTVVSRDDPADAGGAFPRRALRWAHADEQPLIFYHVVRGGQAMSGVVLVSDGEPELRLEPFRPNELGELFTELREKGALAREWIGVEHADPPQNFIHGMARQSQGEERFDLCERLETWRSRMKDRMGSR